MGHGNGGRRNRSWSLRSLLLPAVLLGCATPAGGAPRPGPEAPPASSATLQGAGQVIRWKEAERRPEPHHQLLVQFIREHAAALAGPLGVLVLFDASVKPRRLLATAAPEQVERVLVREAPAYWVFVTTAERGLEAELGSRDVVLTVSLPASSDLVVRRGVRPSPLRRDPPQDLLSRLVTLCGFARAEHPRVPLSWDVSAGSHEKLTLDTSAPIEKQLDLASDHLQAQPLERYLLCACTDGRCWGEVGERDQVTSFDEAEGVLTRHTVSARRAAR